MTWLAWRQFRTQALVAVGALAVLAVILIVTGTHLRHLYDATVATCASHGDCQTASQSLAGQYHNIQSWLGFLIAVVPAVIGVFWGAPLVARELETGTYRMAWTQSVTRTRWLAIKLALVGVAAMAVSGLLSLAVTWWFGPIDLLSANQFGVFDQRDLVAVGYAAFAFALGVTAGTLIRRTLPAMAVTLGVFVAARLSFMVWIRPDLFAPLHRGLALDAASTGFFSSNGGAMQLQPNPPDLPNAWIYTTRIADRAGHPLPTGVVSSSCPTLGVGLPPPAPSGGSGRRIRGAVPGDVQSTLERCVTKLSAHYHTVVTYQPANRYWTFQWTETAIFLGAALLLVGFSLWWVRRHLS
jgi:hypothetical protein